MDPSSAAPPGEKYRPAEFPVVFLRWPDDSKPKENVFEF